MKRTIMEKLGLEPVKSLNKAICLRRARYLRRGLEQKKYRSELEHYARYYANWYSWLADNGGTRARRRAA